MSNTKLRHAVALVLALALILAACGVSSADDASLEGDLDALIAATVEGTGVDYEPLADPEDARRLADLIVVGSLVDIRSGVTLFPKNSPARPTEPSAEDDPDRSDLIPADSRSPYRVAYVVEVTEVLWRSESVPKVPDTIEVQVLASTKTTPAELALLNSGPRVVVALDLMADSDFGDDDLSLRTADGEDVASAFFPYTDLFWLDEGHGAKSHYLQDLTDLAPGWGVVRSIHDLIAAFRE